jgi:prevent-host-death family protein
MSEAYSLDEAPGGLSELVSKAARAHERVVLTDHGRPVAAIVPLDDLHALDDAADRADIALCESILARGDTPIPHEQVVAMLDEIDDQQA